MNRRRVTARTSPLRLEDDPDYSPDDEDDEPPYGEDDDDEDGDEDDEDDDEEEEEVWQVGLTSGSELPRLAPISQLSQLVTRPASPPDSR